MIDEPDMIVHRSALIVWNLTAPPTIGWRAFERTIRAVGNMRLAVHECEYDTYVETVDGFDWVVG